MGYGLMRFLGFQIESFYPNKCRTTSCTLATLIICIAYDSLGSLQYFEITIEPKPSFSASRIRCSILGTGRTSPASPISAAKHRDLSIGISTLEESTAAATARSMAGSSTEMPPVILRNTSLAPNLKPARFSRTASSMFRRFALKPVADRCGVP